LLPDIPHHFLVIEGNIGAGKTTLCLMLERDYQCRLILEQFTDNPFLPYFYENPERYAFPVELFFMTERHKQLQEMLTQGELFPQTIVADYFFMKTLLFAKNNLSDEEFRLFQRLFHVLNAQFRKPDLLVYLFRPVEALLKNIQSRGREIEKNIKGVYLEQIQKSYLDYFKNLTNTPVLILHLGESSFWEDEAAYQKILSQIGQEYPPGLHTTFLE
jgi:deoxyadenosine/deoxycytidine kinase